MKICAKPEKSEKPKKTARKMLMKLTAGFNRYSGKEWHLQMTSKLDWISLKMLVKQDLHSLRTRSNNFDLHPSCQFHQRFLRMFFVQNFCRQNFKPKSQLRSFWRQNFVQKTLEKNADEINNRMRKVTRTSFTSGCQCRALIDVETSLPIVVQSKAGRTHAKGLAVAKTASNVKSYWFV